MDPWRSFQSGGEAERGGRLEAQIPALFKLVRLTAMMDTLVVIFISSVLSSPLNGNPNRSGQNIAPQLPRYRRYGNYNSCIPLPPPTYYLQCQIFHPIAKLLYSPTPRRRFFFLSRPGADFISASGYCASIYCLIV